MDGHASPVVLINLFEVPATADDGFVAGWERARDFMAAQDGYLSTELHRSLAPGRRFPLRQRCPVAVGRRLHGGHVPT